VFGYDHRGRLTSEYRTVIAANGGAGWYTLSYTYDLGGNRLTKVDDLHGTTDVYHYDLENPALYGSKNNRLMYIETADDAGPVSKTYYYYNDHGNVERIATKTEGQDQIAVTRMVYARNRRAVTYVVGERWDWDGVQGSCPTNYVADYVTEFMYDGARQRHAVREIDPATINPGNPPYWVTSEVFSEYDGDTIYNDFTAVGSDVSILRSYEPGIARVDDPLGSPVTSYYHADKLGTTRGMTTAPVSLTDTSVYTAFGELVDGTNHRYGYVGSEGYQAHDEFPLLHVGARYYDPSTGRFAQRDPIGIRGGLNVYEYVRNQPTVGVDPDGLFDWFEGTKWTIVGILGGAAIIALAPTVGAAAIAFACATPVASGLAGGLERSDIEAVKHWYSTWNPQIDIDVSGIEHPDPPEWKSDKKCIQGCHREQGPVE